MNSEIAKSRIGEVIRIDTVTSTQADFLATHVPVNNIHIRKKWDSKSDKVMSEEQVFNKYVLNSENNHQFIIVIGSSGAGKSHLIRWFAARLEQSVPENEVVLFVRRSRACFLSILLIVKHRHLFYVDFFVFLRFEMRIRGAGEREERLLSLESHFLRK